MAEEKQIGRICMVVEIDGTPCNVCLPQERMRMLASMAASLSDNGELPVKEMGKEYHFEELSND